MAERLIITNGDTAATGIEAAGLVASVLPWRDVLHDGPVPRASSLQALSRIRGRYFAEGSGRPAEIDHGFAERDTVISDHHKFNRIELWFEHDLCDQLQLIQVLAVLSEFGRLHDVFLVQADDYFGPMSADAIRALEPTARAVTGQQFAAAADAWSAFTAAAPDALTAIASRSSPLPYLPAALQRLFGELPALRSGLSLTEERILTAMVAGPRKIGALFKAVQDQEEARFLGDASFFRRVDGLSECPVPLINGLPFPSRRCSEGSAHPDYRAFASAEISLTAAGRAALAGTFDHAGENGIDRWLGGTHLTPHNLWRRDRNGGLVPPTFRH